MPSLSRASRPYYPYSVGANVQPGPSDGAFAREARLDLAGRKVCVLDAPRSSRDGPPILLRAVRPALPRVSARPQGRAATVCRGSGVPDTATGADHPFHIHVNPCWVTRIDVPDETGTLHNILDAPQWMDTVSIPRGGRVVFRSRFADYVGMWANQCHILMHEDHGMMQAVETLARPEESNYHPRTRVASHAMSASDVSAVYPPPGPDVMYRQNLSFVDSSPDLGQVFPGFPLEVPRLP